MNEKELEKLIQRAISFGNQMCGKELEKLIQRAISFGNRMYGFGSFVPSDGDNFFKKQVNNAQKEEGDFLKFLRKYDAKLRKKL